MDTLILSNLPMPPSANSRLVPINGRLIKSAECRTYTKAIDIWMIRQRSGLFDIRRKAKDWIDHGFLLKAVCDFYWPKEKLISKSGHPKKLDLDNRLKNFLDSLTNIIDIDDKYIIEIHASKIPWPNHYEEINCVLYPTSWKEV